jgi:hypothetical protein
MSPLPNALGTRLVVRGWWANVFLPSSRSYRTQKPDFQKLTLDWYGEGERTLEICTGTALWYRYGYDPLPIRWVLTRDPLGKRPPKAIFSTDPTQTAEQIISDFMKRWSLEVTFEESRAHLGIETQRQWSDRAIERATPLLFGLSSLVALFGQALHPDGHIPVARVSLVSQADRHL